MYVTAGTCCLHEFRRTIKVVLAKGMASHGAGKSKKTVAGGLHSGDASASERRVRPTCIDVLRISKSISAHISMTNLDDLIQAVLCKFVSGLTATCFVKLETVKLPSFANCTSDSM